MTVRGLEDTLADGLFHAATWIATALGTYLLWRAVKGGATPWSGRRLLGWVFFGWGLFNLIEGIANHHLLTIHHVREGVDNNEVYDIAFLVFGARGGRGGGRSPCADRRNGEAPSSNGGFDDGTARFQTTAGPRDANLREGP